MRSDAAQADRRREVHLAARGWHDAGAIDEATRRAVEGRFPDDRARLGPAFRALAFLFTFVTAQALFGVVMLAVNCGSSTSEGLMAFLCLAFGVALTAATEVLTGPMRRADAGVEAATGLLATGYVAGGLTWMVERAGGEDATVFTALFLMTTVVGALGAYRWGFSFLALGAAVAGFVLMARTPVGRWLWIAVPLALAAPLLAAADSPRLSPSHRRCVQAVLLVAVGALYVAIHLGSFDDRVIEHIADFHGAPPLPAWLRPLSVLATALMPPALLLLAVLTRRVLMMRVAVVLGVASLVTLRFYVSVAPLWVVLTAAGTAALLVVFGVRRLLASGADGERGGLTAEPLFDDSEKREAMEMISAAAALSPAARTGAAGDKLETGGGRYGGGGASDTY
jgi:hypothetical protein